ncbi:MAG: hypothetical protein U9O59_03965 [Actinomycetota bacterium]|nr:hypothetical protein [Actinomycetota bacterium]
MFKEEKERLLRIKKFYMEKTQKLPKGSIIFKKRGKRKYPYLVYRYKKKVKTDYLKCSPDELKELEFKIKKRKKYQNLLKDIEKDLKAFK